MVEKVATFDSTIKVIWQLSSTVRMLIMTVPESFHHVPGQFVSLIFNDEQGEEVRRPYSVASEVKADHTIDLCIKIVEHGKASHYISTLKAGDMVSLMGPMGRFRIPDEKQGNDLAFISTGTGIAPFRAMLRTLLQSGAKQRLFVFTGYRYEDEELYKDEMEQAAREHPNLIYKAIISRPKDTAYAADKGHVQDLIDRYLPADFGGEFLLCGLTPMIKETSAHLKEMGVGDDRIHFEKYD